MKLFAYDYFFSERRKNISDIVASRESVSTPL